jgi:hypothetical protein
LPGWVPPCMLSTWACSPCGLGVTSQAAGSSQGCRADPH